MTIPIANVYYLLCYAWDKLEEGEIVDVAGIPSARLPDLFAHVLVGAVSRLLRTGLDRGYIEIEDETARPRGRIDLTGSIRRALMVRGRLHCRYDELTYDVLHNRLIKSTMEYLLLLRDLDGSLRESLEGLYRKLAEVTSMRLETRAFRRVQLHRNIRFYEFALRVCELVAANLLVDEESGEAQFRDFVRDEKAMARLFEAFVRNFYRREQVRYAVTRERVAWDGQGISSTDASWLPAMQTDAILRSAERTIVLETKYYGEALQRHYDHEAVRSGHLYQLFAYLRNIEARGDAYQHTEGMLLCQNG
jgi:5-methylcytosine-specific restriction enzyme subunit McrC